MSFLSNTENLETPCLVIDVAKAKRNILNMQQAVSAAGCTLRPHIKTHKMPYFAKLQLEAGACGITCAKVTEAQVMADSGIDDIFIAYPLVGAFRIKRAIELNKKIRRLILAVDSLEGATALNNAAEAAGVILEVRLEVDTGAKRTGVLYDTALSLAKEIDGLKHLKLTGIYTFKSLVLMGKSTLDNAAAAKEEAQLMNSLAEKLRQAGISIVDVSAGSTPTGIQVAETGLVTEVRPGTYIFNDYMVTKEKSADFDDIAVRMYATVVSTPEKGYAVIDGGTKTFPMDITPDTEPYFYPGYTVITDKSGAPDLNLKLTRMNEEHGIITASNGETGLKVGDLLELIPIHICTALNMQNNVWLCENGNLTLHRVDARGMLI